MKKPVRLSCKWVFKFVLVLMIFVLLIPGFSVFAAGNNMGNATSISVNTSYSGSISSSNTADYYKFTIKSGTVKVKATWNMNHVYWAILDSSGESVYSKYNDYDSTLGANQTNYDCYLTGGTYYFCVETSYQSSGIYGTYSFKLVYTDANESFSETQSSANNNMSKASSASVNNQYIGIIGPNDTKDYYKFTIKSGTVKVKATWNMNHVYWAILDSSGESVYSKYNDYDSTLGANQTNYDCYLTGGTYYFCVETSYQSSGIYGTYSFKLVYTDANESFSETQSSANNSMKTANTISLNTSYKGLIAANDGDDYYKFTTKTGSVTVKATWNMDHVYWGILNSSGESIYSRYADYDSSSGNNKTNYEITLNNGTYYFYVETSYQSSGIYGTYSFKLSTGIPEITTQPKSVSTTSGATAKFTVVASGTGLKYQWQWSKDGGSTWENCTSATTGYNKATLQVSAETKRNGYKYRCKVSNTAGSVTSKAVTLTIITKPKITTQPQSVSTASGTTAKFTVAASGSELKYQWQWSKDGGSTWENCTSATTGYNKATLQVSAEAKRNGYKYRCKVSNAAGSVTSSTATLTLVTKPKITAQPKSVVADAGTTAKFTVTASGTGLKYQWQWSKDGGSTWENCTSATTGYNKATLQVSAEARRNGYKYRCKVSNAAGSVISNAVTLVVD